MVKDKDKPDPVTSGIPTEQKILQAAEREFIEKGFAGARTSAIAEEAGVTHAMLHYYYRTKENLFDNVVAQKMQLFGETLFGSIDPEEKSLTEMLTKIISLHIEFIAKNPGLPRFLISEIFSNKERMDIYIVKFHHAFMKIIGLLEKRIDLAEERGEARKVDARALMIQILSLNVLPFVITPMIDAIFPVGSDNPEEFIENRKRENIDTILRKIRP